MKKKINQATGNCNESTCNEDVLPDPLDCKSAERLGRLYQKALRPLRKEYAKYVRARLDELSERIEAGYFTDMGDSYTWAEPGAFIPPGALLSTSVSTRDTEEWEPSGDPDPTGRGRPCLQLGIVLLEREIARSWPMDDLAFAMAIITFSRHDYDNDRTDERSIAIECLASDIRDAYRARLGARHG